MKSLQDRSCNIVEGPCVMKLFLALFDRSRPEPIKFIGTEDGRKVDICVWLKGLTRAGEHSWDFTGTLTADSPLNPSKGIGPSLKVIGFYNEQKRRGIISGVGMDTDMYTDVDY